MKLRPSHHDRAESHLAVAEELVVAAHEQIDAAESHNLKAAVLHEAEIERHSEKLHEANQRLKKILAARKRLTQA